MVQPRKGYADTQDLGPGLQAGQPGAIGPDLARARRRDIRAARLARARDAGEDAQRAAALGRGRARRLQHAQARAGSARRHERGELAGARVERVVPQQHACFLGTGMQSCHSRFGCNRWRRPGVAESAALDCSAVRHGSRPAY